MIVFSLVTASVENKNTSFLACGIPKKEELPFYAAFDNFLKSMNEDRKKIKVAIYTYGYGEEEQYDASIEEVLYLTRRLYNANRADPFTTCNPFLQRSCNFISQKNETFKRKDFSTLVVG